MIFYMKGYNYVKFRPPTSLWGEITSIVSTAALSDEPVFIFLVGRQLESAHAALRQGQTAFDNDSWPGWAIISSAGRRCKEAVCTCTILQYSVGERGRRLIDTIITCSYSISIGHCSSYLVASSRLRAGKLLVDT